jgi:hypothetical protein
MIPIADEQRHRNDQSRSSWDRFRAHREQVTRLLVNSAAPHDQLCLLGAGNANDLDLKQLLTAYGRVHLVDLDADALEHAVTAQNCKDPHRVFLHGGIDLTFIGNLLEQLSADLSAPDRPAIIDNCLRISGLDQPVDLPAPFEAVASVCLLTQLLESVELALGAEHSQCLGLKMGIRASHLRLLLRLLKPGGTAVLFLDFVSSATFPQLSELPERNLVDTAVKLIGERNFFTGLNPFVIGQLFRVNPTLAPFVERVEVTEPWRWDFGPRSYLVCAIVVRRNNRLMSEVEL